MSGMTEVIVIVNKHTGARCVAAPNFRLGDEQAYLVKDSELNKCELENFNLGRIKGRVEGIILMAIGAAAFIWWRKKRSKKNHEKEEE